MSYVLPVSSEHGWRFLLLEATGECMYVLAKGEGGGLYMKPQHHYVMVFFFGLYVSLISGFFKEAGEIRVSAWAGG